VTKRSLRTSTGRGLEPWPVLGLLLLTVVVPTACVLWFMSAAMRNERLAVRQRLTQAYRQHALAAQEALEKHWLDKQRALAKADKLPAARIFAELVTSGVADSVVVYDKAGQLEYPLLEAPLAAEPDEPSSPWLAAGELEYQQRLPGKAAEAYATIPREAKDRNLTARALRAQARCLAQAGRKHEAVVILTGPLASAELRGARGAGGRLIAPDALLLALELAEETDSRQFRALAGKLADRLSDYGDPAMPSGQRRFLMLALREVAPDVPAFPTLAAEHLAAEYLEARPPPARPLQLSRAPGDLWNFPSAGGEVAAIFRTETLLAEMRSAGRLDEPFAGATLALVRPGSPPAEAEAVLAVAAPRQMPGWKLELRLAGEEPFAAAASRRNAIYLWTGIVGIVIIAVLALMVGRFVSRQMRLARLKNDLIATVSHELKTPLASIRVLVDTLLAGRYQDQWQAREYFSLIARENERLTRLIDNFLTFSRMERKKVAFEFGPVKLDEVVAAAVEAMADRLNGPNCKLEVRVAPDLPAITADRDALVTVLLNLLDNAYKYSKDDKRIAVRAYEADANVCLEVADNGIGLSRRAAKNIFDRFYQVDQSLTRSAGGCGLGLSIVKFIVDAHGGSIDVATQPGKGSSFTVRLPVGGAAGAAGSRKD